MPENSNNQIHGKCFENMIKAANGIFSLAAANKQRLPSQIFDIDAGDDQAQSLDTSIVSTKSGTLGLSDARKFWRSCNFLPYRILIGQYQQQENIKVFGSIIEVILQPSYRSALLGGVTESEINDFHVGLKKFGPGVEQQRLASVWAKNQKLKFRDKVGLVVLNPKIDAGNQRRLQCSVTLTNLFGILQTSDYTLHRDAFGKLALPLRIASGRRKIGR